MATPTTKLLSKVTLVISFFVGLIYSSANAYEGDLYLPERGNSHVVFVSHSVLTDINPSDVFQVFVGDSDQCCEAMLPMAGSYSLEGNTVKFIPAFEFIEGQNYTVQVANHDNDIGDVDTNRSTHFLNEFTIKRTVENVTPEITYVYPSGSDIPENTLRFYVHFSTPMRPHVSDQYIMLLDASGTPDTQAFMSFKQELWSKDRKRLTLLMDPGRIKRGVAQNLTLGPALQEGNTYSIVVEAGWPTANNTQVMLGFKKKFIVSKALRTLPDPDRWTIDLPEKLTTDPLLIEFDRPFDAELLLTGISVLDESGQPIQGAISVEKQERLWRFKRDGIWLNSQIQIVLDTQLEDVAGNNFIELLDQSVGTEASVLNQKIITLDLKVSPI